MNRERLLRLTDQEHICRDSFSLEGGLPREKYVLTVGEGGWLVYYSERGERTGLHRFDTEDEACCYLFDLLLEDDTTRDLR